MAGVLSSINNNRRNFIAEHFDKMTPSMIGKVIGIDGTAVRKRIKRMGLTLGGNELRKASNNTCNLHFFREWNPDMAYVLGLLFADGSINENSINLEMTDSDMDVLEFVRSAMGVKRELAHYHFAVNPHSRLTVNSRSMIADLIQLGLRQRKTFRDDPFPQVPDAYLGHLIRGYFDGDGSVRVASKGACNLKFIGTPQFIDGMMDRMEKVAGIRRKRMPLFYGKEAIWTVVTWTNPRDLRIIHDLMYPKNGYSFAMNRKRKILIDWLDKPRIEMKEWTKEAEQVVREHYSSLGPYRVGKMIDRYSSAVRIKAKKLGLTYQPKTHSNRS